jgi:energy-coupling factor transporter ATP-binding protein EcfA2
MTNRAARAVAVGPVHGQPIHPDHLAFVTARYRVAFFPGKWRDPRVLTRLEVDGFKNLVDVAIDFGPFTCIAGANGSGKSNLFDAILFLSALADRPLAEGAASVRADGGRATDPRSLFHRVGTTVAETMSFAAEMLVPQAGVDDLGQTAQAAITFLRYELKLGLRDNILVVRHEALNHITVGSARSHLRFEHSPEWRRSVVLGRRTSAFISTETVDNVAQVKLHQDMGADYKGGGRPRNHIAERLPRTVLSSASATESGTALVARREMQSWRLLALEPTALRQPDAYASPTAMAPNGLHLPAALARLAKLDASHRRNGRRPTGDPVASEQAAVYGDVCPRLAGFKRSYRSSL